MLLLHWMVAMLLLADPMGRYRQQIVNVGTTGPMATKWDSGLFIVVKSSHNFETTGVLASVAATLDGGNIAAS